MKLNILLGVVLLAPSLAFAQTPIQPGLWQMTSMPHDIVLPAGLPPQLAAMARGVPETVEKCVTPEQVKDGPRTLTQLDPECHYTRYDFSNGKLNAAATCKRPSGTVQHTYTATFTDTSFTMNGVLQGQGPSSISMKTTMTGKRIGPCK